MWWEDVGEDGATLEGGSATQVMTVDCGGANKATDKVFQHNGAGTMILHNFFADTFGKLYRSCGNCSGQYTRHAELDMITATGGGALAGVNETYMDTARFTNISRGKRHHHLRTMGSEQYRCRTQSSWQRSRREVLHLSTVGHPPALKRSSTCHALLYRRIALACPADSTIAAQARRYT